MAEELYRLPVRELGRRLRDGTLTASQLLEHYLSRIADLNAALNAFTVVDSEGARKAASESDHRLQSGHARSPLEGIPVAIKDNILVQGQRAVWGTRLFENHVADHDELPITLLRAGGAVLIGKTNVPEFTLRGFTGNPVFGVTGNAWNPALTPGGSSGGSAAAVAAGLVPLSLGTDGGGSIRRPSGYNGLVGLKPTLSRIPRAGGFPQILYDCEIVGPIGRTTDDVRLMLSVLAKPDRRDQRSRGFAAIGTETTPLRPLKILFVERFEEAPVDPDIVRSCREAAERLKALGHDVSAGPMPFSTARIIGEWSKLGNVGLSMLAQHHPDFFERVSPDFADQARAGAEISGGEYLQLLEMLFAFRVEVGAAFNNVDIIMTPTAAANPWPKAQAFPSIIDGQNVGPRGHAVFTNWVNASGHPSIALPASQTPDGMPIGFQLVGDFGVDDLLLNLAAQYEAAHPWAQRWPAHRSID
jgi:aspartyl-tRNA(Asn)/glutamyl-tRNA(Gln) amidotransferase subunit A